MIRLCYFASLRETLGTGEEQLELPGNVTTVAQLSAWLQTRSPTGKRRWAIRACIPHSTSASSGRIHVYTTATR